MPIDRAELLFTGLLQADRGSPRDGLGGQVRAALNRLAETLSERGLGLEDLLRLRLFVGDLGETAAIEEALQAHLGSERPAVSIVELPAGGSDREGGRAADGGQREADRGIAVTLDAVAAPGACTRRRLGPGSVRLGPWVFLGALAAVEPRTLFARMEEGLREQGAELSDVVKVGGWLTFGMRDYGPLGQARSALVGEAGLLPASAAVQVAGVGCGGERLAFEAIAYAPEDRGGGESSASSSSSSSSSSASSASPSPPPVAVAATHTTSRLADFYVDARAVGGYLFTSGEVPDGRGSPAEQASEIYERLGAHLAAHGTTPADVVGQTVFLRAAGDSENRAAVAEGTVVTEAARAFYGNGPLPPTTLLPVADFGFRPGCAVEIELVARIGG